MSGGQSYPRAFKDRFNMQRSRRRVGAGPDEPLQIVVLIGGLELRVGEACDIL